MKAKSIILCLLFAVIGTSASAHRLDEYLQAATISVENGRIQAQLRLTPGIAVFNTVFSKIDANGDGSISESEKQAYCECVLRDLRLTLDNQRLPAHILRFTYPSVADMKDGRGEIEIELAADAPRRNGSRVLVLENCHQIRIAAYLVNCLVPADPSIQVTAQHRNYTQSRYELDYVQSGAEPAIPPIAAHHTLARWLAAATLLLVAPIAVAWTLGRIRRKELLQKGKLADSELATAGGAA